MQEPDALRRERRIAVALHEQVAVEADRSGVVPSAYTSGVPGVRRPRAARAPRRSSAASAVEAGLRGTSALNSSSGCSAPQLPHVDAQARSPRQPVGREHALDRRRQRRLRGGLFGRAPGRPRRAPAEPSDDPQAGARRVGSDDGQCRHRRASRGRSRRERHAAASACSKPVRHDAWCGVQPSARTARGSFGSARHARS